MDLITGKNVWKSISSHEQMGISLETSKLKST